MASIRQSAFVQILATLKKLVPSVFVQILDEPKPDITDPERPYCWCKNGPDIRHELIGTGGVDEELETQIYIRIAGKYDDENLGKDLEDLIEAVKTQIKADIGDSVFLKLTPAIWVTGYPVISDPDLDWQRDRSCATISFRFMNNVDEGC